MSHSTNRHYYVVPRSKFYYGKFGRLFHSQAWRPNGILDENLEQYFLEFVKGNMIESTNPDTNNSKIPAGYTYFGQFIDHDLTLDVTPWSQTDVDPENIHNFRTPRLDLDCVYGRGPVDQPYLYEHEGELSKQKFTGKMLVGDRILDTNFFDLPRNSDERAIIGDMRNDENAVVAQMHLAFILAHNKLVDRAKKIHGSKDGMVLFSLARRTLCWLYQWVVWNDFLTLVTLQDVHKVALKRSGNGLWKLGLQEIYNWKNEPFIPVEFSVAVYRFGHSLVRNKYQTNNSEAAGIKDFIPLFDSDENNEDLRGFRALSKRRGVQWDWFLQMESSKDPFPQHARKIDTVLSKSLTNLPGESSDFSSALAARNLLRGVRMELPSGPDVAVEVGLEPLDLDEKQDLEALWYYILKEAKVKQGGEILGALGSRILCAVFAGILKGDANSWVNMAPNWTPGDDPLLKNSGFNADNQLGHWKLASIVRLSGLPVSDNEIPQSRSGGDSAYSGGEVIGGGGLTKEKLR